MRRVACCLWLAEVVGQGRSLNKVGMAGVADTCIGGAIYPDRTQQQNQRSL